MVCTHHGAHVLSQRQTSQTLVHNNYKLCTLNNVLFLFFTDVSMTDLFDFMIYDGMGLFILVAVA